MIGASELFVDTNVLIYYLNGDQTLAELFQGKDLYLSIVTEMELLSYPSLSLTDRTLIESLIDNCFVINIVPQVKQFAIEYRSKFRLKLPDAVVAATARFLEIPFLTADEGFRKINELDLFFYER
jgi:hypothetical protein